jgi:hypothetical protein
MANRSFLSLVTRIAPSVPGCPQPVIEQYVRDAAIEACERTLGWRYEQPLIRLTPGVYDYPYENPTGSEVHAFLTASVNGSPLEPMTLEQIHRIYPDWPSTDQSKRSDPRYIFQIDVDNFAIAPIPGDDKDYDVKMIVALKPLRDSTGMDKTAFDDLENVIMHGALQHLLVLPNKNWSDRELAAYHAKQYLFKTVERRARNNIGASRATVSVQMRPLA